MAAKPLTPRISHSTDQSRSEQRWVIVACCAVFVVTLLAFSRSLAFRFLRHDDAIFIYNEPHVYDGFSWANIVWAFTAGPHGEWCPTTMLSHMLDCQLYGLNPVGHHLTNVLLHALAAAVLLWVLVRRTGQRAMPEAAQASGVRVAPAGPSATTRWASALVVALFAVHPLRVESVAWMAERRDVLSGLFFGLTLASYVEYVRRPESRARYLAVIGLFALGLMAKSILVTMPVLLLLLDFWPLGRFQPGASTTSPRQTAWRLTGKKLIREKLPLFGLSAASCVMTLVSHANPGPNPELSIPARLANAAVSCVAYLGQMFVPHGLSVFYPYPETGYPVWQVAGACVLLAAITAAAVVGRRSYPWLFVGWFWYLVVLLPVIELIAVGGHARADRYTYLAQIGINIALVWSLARWSAARPARRWVLSVGAALVLAALMATTWRQTGFWRLDRTLWEHALACDEQNATAHYSLAVSLQRRETPAAVEHCQQALRLESSARDLYWGVRSQAASLLGDIAAREGNISEAKDDFEAALKFWPAFGQARTKIGFLLANEKDFPAARLEAERGAELESDNAAAWRNLAQILTQAGDPGAAITAYRKSLALDDQSGFAHMQLARLLVKQRNIDESDRELRRAIAVDPDTATPYYQLAQLLRSQGLTREADQLNAQGGDAALRSAKAKDRRGLQLVQCGMVDEAIDQFQAAIDAAPKVTTSYCHLAEALAAMGDYDEAIVRFRAALEIDPNLSLAHERIEELSHR